MATQAFPRKFQNIQALRGISILLIILYHLLAIEQKYNHGVAVLPDCFYIAFSAVDLFFIISGFVMVAVSQGQFRHQYAIQNFIYHRLTRIFPAYWFYFFILLVIYLIKPNLINASQAHQVNLLESFFLLPQDKLPLIAVGWTLTYELYFYMVFACFLALPEKYFRYAIAVWASIILIVTFSTPNFSSPTLQVIFNPLTLEFIAGCVIGRLLYAGIHKYGSFFLVFGSTLLIINYLLYRQFISHTVPDGLLRVCLYGIPQACIVYAAVALEIRRNYFSKLLVLLGDSSYSTYLTHVMVLSVLGRLWNIIFIPNKFIMIMAFITMVVSCLVFGYISYRLLEKPLIAFFRHKSPSTLRNKELKKDLQI